MELPATAFPGMVPKQENLRAKLRNTEVFLLFFFPALKTINKGRIEK